MKAIQRSLIVLLLCLTVLWLMADASSLSVAIGLFPWRVLLIQYSGVLAIGTMSVAMILAMRPVGIESYFNGLDKMYRLHKWLGIAGLAFAASHWLLVKVPQWLVGAGWLERPMRGKRPEQSVDIFRFLQSQRGLAEQIGEWTFYVLVVLLAIALIRRIRYHYFFKTHRLLPLAYLALVLHAVVLMKFEYWASPLGLVMGALMTAGSVGAFISLFRRIGTSRKAKGVIGKVEYFKDTSVNAVTIQLKNRWAGHEAGQFAFVTFDAREGAHPFTISSSWENDNQLYFLIKSQGDYTKTLASTLKSGDAVTVEGPYGRFNFEGVSQRQIWISGGIGITPFIARMKALTARPDGREVDLFHATSKADEIALQLLAEDAKLAGVRLHVMISARDGRLTGERLRSKVPDWAAADVWFCGAISFGEAIRHDLIKNGLPAGRFHQELFVMR